MRSSRRSARMTNYSASSRSPTGSATSPFDEDDVEVLRTLANHVAVALRNSLLLERLERALAHETEMNRLKDDFVATVSHSSVRPSPTSKGS